MRSKTILMKLNTQCNRHLISYFSSSEINVHSDWFETINLASIDRNQYGIVIDCFDIRGISHCWESYWTLLNLQNHCFTITICRNTKHWAGFHPLWYCNCCSSRRFFLILNSFHIIFRGKHELENLYGSCKT